MTVPNDLTINSTNPHTYDEHIKPVKNGKLKNFIKKSLLLITTLGGVVIGVLTGAYYHFQHKKLSEI